MALNFPSSPSTGQLYSYGNKTWIWDGTGWGATTSGTVPAFYVSSSADTSIMLSSSDTGKYIRTTAATSVSVTVAPQVTVSWQENTEIIFEQAGAGQITFVTGSGVIINSSETLKSQKQYSVVGIKRTSQDVWTLAGERELL